jgi:ribosomal protein L37AE/L43A
MTMNDSIVDRAERVEHSLKAVSDPTARAAVGGPCPSCGARVETVLRCETTSVTCDACGSEFPIAA